MRRFDGQPFRILGTLSWTGVLLLLVSMGGQASGEDWLSYGGNPQHTALSPGPSQLPQQIRWSTPVDMAPQYSGSVLYVHYGSPVISESNNVFVPVKVGATGGFEVKAFRANTGSALWTLPTDYVLPAHNWTPPMGITLSVDNKMLAIPGAGGTVLVRTAPNSPQGIVIREAFFGIKNYESNPSAFNGAIQICTPITMDSRHTLYFGYLSNGQALPGYPNGIPSGIARLPIKGTGSFASAESLCGDTNIQKPVYNCAPALTPNGANLYIAVNQSSYSQGYLCQVNAKTLAPVSSALLKDPRNSAWKASLPDDGTASPTIGPDGDVYYGVLEANFPSNHARGWMLHFDSTLATVKTPGAFGWDDSASIVPARLVKSYTGTSSYLVLTKYNNYSDPGIGGNGENKVAILDPNATMADPVTGATVMNEVITVVGVTANPSLPGVDEWCINSAAVDTANACAVVNSEDGHVYRWDFATNSLSPGLKLAPPTGEAYTSTAIGPDGAVYAINNAVLASCVATGSSGVHRLGSVDAGETSPPAGRFRLAAVYGLLVVLGTLAAVSLQLGSSRIRRSRRS